MSTKRLVALLLVGASVVAGVPAQGRNRVEPERAGCYACLVVDEEGRVLFARRANVPLPNASTTKIATALVVVDATQPGEPVTVSEAAAATGGGGLALEPGDRASVEDLLAALLLSSSNDAAVALAEHVAGTEEAFVEAMNERVRALGAAATRFTTSHGLDAPGHVSSAADLARLARALLDDPFLAEVVARPRDVIEVSGRPLRLENRNLLLETYPGAIGVKTGYTLGAGNVLVAAARRRGRTLVAVAMRSVDAAADASLLLDHGFARLARTLLVRAGAPVGALVFSSGATHVVAARAARGPSRREDVTVAFRPGARAPVRAGDIVGTVGVQGGGGVSITLPAVAADTVAAPTASGLAGGLAAVLRAAATAVGRR
jgi:serine-type D-Ala-D-Ala carboxypeptidase (penicillin-binding protein 5/6)